jgi:hypothetical protein
MNDVLIRADDIIEHYNTLKLHHPHLAYVKLFEGFSHIDFTYGSHQTLTSEIIKAAKDFSGPQIKLNKYKTVVSVIKEVPLDL